MTKQDIVNVVSEATGLTKVETEAVMNGVMTTIINALTENQRVELRGFDTFGVKHRMPKNFETGTMSSSTRRMPKNSMAIRVNCCRRQTKNCFSNRWTTRL